MSRRELLPVELRFEAPGRLLSLNDRDHYRTRAELVRSWRMVAQLAGRQIGAPRAVGPTLVHVVLPVPDRRARDPHNYVATLKPIVDGLVDAGLWPDDTPEHVATLEPELERRRPRIVSVHLMPLVCPLCAGEHHAARCERAAWARPYLEQNVIEL